MSKILLERGADVNARGREGRTSLHQAARFEPTALFKTLVAHSGNGRPADTDATDVQGATPLWYATEASNTGIVEFLLAPGDKKLNINARGKMNKSIIHVAADNGSPAVIVSIPQHNPDINVVDDAGYTPIRYIRRRPTMEACYLRQLSTSDEDHDGDAPESTWVIR